MASAVLPRNLRRAEQVWRRRIRLPVGDTAAPLSCRIRCAIERTDSACLEDTEDGAGLYDQEIASLDSARTKLSNQLVLYNKILFERKF